MSLDTTDATTIRDRIARWSASGSMKYDTLVYQMSGRPSVDPYGWHRRRIDAAIKNGCQFGILKKIELFDGHHIAIV
jgi:hypothetical protein